MRAADTNILVRLIARDDARQVEAAKAFIADGGAWVSVLALAESIWTLGSIYRMKRPEIEAAIEMFLNHEQLVLQDWEVVSAAFDLFRVRTSVSFADCLMLQLARKAGHLPLGTFDRGLGRLDGAQQV